MTLKKQKTRKLILKCMILFIFSSSYLSIFFRNKPGKLKYNLNINVGALRPGAIPSRRTDGTNNVTSMAEETSTTETIDKKSLDETDQVTILPSVTKVFFLVFFFSIFIDLI